MVVLFAFFAAGPVVHVDVLKSFSGRPKGCGVVEYQYPEDARRAIRTLNQVEFLGRPVFIREDRVFEHSAPVRDPHDVPEDCKLHVSNLPPNASWQDMKDLFRKAGRVLHTDVYTEPGSRRSNGHGTVIFDDSRYARAAIDIFNGYEWQGYNLEVKEERYSNRSSPMTTATSRPLPPPSSRPVELPHNTPPTNVMSENASSSSRAATPTTAVPPPSAAVSSTQSPILQPVPTDAHHVQQLPPPPPPLPAAAVYQNVYRYGAGDNSSTSPIIPPPPLSHIPLPPPLPPPFNHIGLIGGPEANTPTHGQNQIYVNNLPFSTTWQDLIDLFRHVGPVLRAEILNVKGHPKGAGFVRFENAALCDKAIEKFNGYVYGGRSLDIRLDKYSTTA
ncbi:hypothetical protein BDF20DRAFT_335808 [Mycotypha africana]|uniref:uncharacterized protein n=1 Tax=Mycotypha africana TaxID=64632 RepID=UPI0022FFDC40|nr:uncharacterized protein BDF20DRAFT_335808 [Mycotypha africana]KAI8988503.1 hypothetical protein BDF20DRAFT_335808 [Mycotypha africana]